MLIRVNVDFDVFMPKPLTPEQLEALKAVPLGEMPNKLRIALALSQASQTDIVAETGIATPNLSRIVNGKYVDIHWATVQKLADFFGCDPRDLFPLRAA